MTEASAVTAPASGEGAAPVAPQTPGNPGTVDINAPKPGEKVYVIKYPDGREEKRGESWLQERAQKSIGLEKRVADADKYEKAFQGFVSRVQDPQQLVELLNHPDLKYDDEKQESLLKAMLSSKKPRVIEAVKRWLYENEVKPSMMDPKEREAMEWKQKAEMLESDKLKREKEEKEAEEAKTVADIKEAYRVKLGEAYQKSGLPIEDDLVRQVMQKARYFTSAGKHPDFDHCCKLVQADLLSRMKFILGKATVENILTLMDGESAQKINKALLNAVNKQGDDIPAPPNGERTVVKRSAKKELTPQERKKWAKNLERGIVD